MCKSLALVFIFSLPTLAQISADTLYAKGLRACLEKEVASYSKFSSRDLRNVIVVKDDKLTEGLPFQLGEIKVQYLSGDQLALAYKNRSTEKKNERREIPIIELIPIHDNEGKLYFAYKNYWFSYSEKGGFFTQKKRVFGFALEGGCHAEIGFDEVEKRFVIGKVELWGI